MMLATGESGTREYAEPGARAQCPACGESVIAKCGEIISWHWAHQASTECDPWAERETYWHAEWQDVVPVQQREIVMGPHRADIVTASGIVVELQHSTISPAEIREREDFYGQMIWLFDATGCDISIRRRQSPVTFRWKHPRKSVDACRRPLWLDLGCGQVLHVGRIFISAPCGGWGHLYTADALQAWMRDGAPLVRAAS